MKVRILPTVLASISLLAIPAMAQDGAASFKTRCAPCHGDQGQGKPNGAPKIAGSSKSEAEIASVLTKGGLAKAPHAKPMNTLNAAQVKSISAYVKTLK